MDQEVSRGTWLGSSLLMLVASIAVAIIIYGLGRTISLGYIDSLAKTFLDTNYSELVELNDSTVPLTKSAVVGLVDRNKSTVKKVTIIKEGTTPAEITSSSGDLTPLTVNDKLLEAGVYTSYNTRVEMNLELGTAEITVYVGK